MGKLSRKWWIWMIWTAVSLAGTGMLARKVFTDGDKSMFLPGQTTSGHYQIELRCEECHTPGKGVLQDACIRCHGEELKTAQDSHPKSKFNDPTKAHLLKNIQADKCIACHVEHNPDATHPMGLTMPLNYCAFCHQEVGDNRPSHKGLGFETCATAGCHNFHDNRALYERFLQQHAEEPALLTNRVTRALSPPRQMGDALEPADIDAPAREWDATLLQEWAENVHAKQGVNCTSCHNIPDDTGAADWTDHPAPSACAGCHQENVDGWMAGRHGMRVAAGLSPMTPAMARLPMQPHSLHRELDCSSCHGAHNYDTRYAAVEACLQCHADDHSLAYKNTSHFTLWENEVSGTASAGTGVSCATCHMPRMENEEGRIIVQHNQNDNLRPNEKMIRSVCMDCHGLEFSLQALADPALVDTCYEGQPAVSLETMPMIRTRIKEIEERRRKTTEQRARAVNNGINEDDL